MRNPICSPARPALSGTRILSLALNLPGPAALMRCAALGAECTKIEPLPAAPNTSADPLHHGCKPAYNALHTQIRCLQADLKTTEGHRLLHAELAQTDVLLTSFRPAALHRLGLDWQQLQPCHPQLSMVRIFGALGCAADTAGHDLTYQAQAGLLNSEHMPTSLLADMAGALMACEAVLQAQLHRLRCGAGTVVDIGLLEAAQWLAQPLHWGLCAPEGNAGGAHAGYRIYRCQDGLVAIAALEPHFAARLCTAAGLPACGDLTTMREASTQIAIARFVQKQSIAQLQAISEQQDIPLQVITAPMH